MGFLLPGLTASQAALAPVFFIKTARTYPLIHTETNGFISRRNKFYITIKI